MKWKRWAALWLAASCLALPLTGCTGEDRLVAGIDANRQPLSYRDASGVLTGFEIDMAEETAKRAGMPVRFVSIDWSRAKETMEKGRVNSLWGDIVPGNMDKTGMLYVKPILYDREIILTPKDTDVTDMASLSGKAVGVLKDSRAAAALAANSVSGKLDGGGAQSFENYSLMFQALSSLQLDAVCLDDSMAEYTAMQDLNDYTVVPGGALATSVYAVGVRRNDNRLRNRLQKALDSIRRDGTAARLSKKWFGKDMTTSAQK